MKLTEHIMHALIQVQLGSGTPLKKYKAIGCLKNTGLDPKENHKVTQHSMLGHHQPVKLTVHAMHARIQAGATGVWNPLEKLQSYRLP